MTARKEDRQTTEHPSFWYKLDVLAKSLLAVAVSGGIAFYGIYSEEKRQREALQERRSSMLIQLVNAREKALTDLRSSMFNALLEHYFKPGPAAATNGVDGSDGSKSLATFTTSDPRILVLEMIGLNFRDAIQIKPLFEQLDRELASDGQGRALLRKAAGNIVKDQIEQIRQSETGVVCKLGLPLGAGKKIPECFDVIGIELTQAEEDKVELAVHRRSEKPDRFGVTFFDMPMVDYTHMALGENSWRYSIALEDIAADGQSATVIVSVLPLDSYRARRSYQFDEALSKHLEDQGNGLEE